MSISDFAGASEELAASFNLFNLTQEFLDDPFPTYAALRTHRPVHHLSDGSVFLSRYKDVVQVYKDRTMSSDKKAEFGPKFGDGGLFRHHTTSLVFNDPPLHTRVRKLLAQAFTPRAMALMEPGIIELVDGLLDKAADRGEMDLIGDFAFALPVGVITEMLGIPAADRDELRDYALIILGALEPTVSADHVKRGNEAVERFCDYLRELVADRRKNLREDDILSTLIAGEIDGERLLEEELLQNCIFLLNAGHETTTNLIGNGMGALLRFPDQLADLIADPGLIDTAMEEFLRIESSNQLGNRRTTVEVEIGGVKVPAETNVHLCIGAANHDPEEFDNPGVLNIRRRPNRHLAFGSGNHICLGNSLARMEGRIVISRLLERFPNIARNGDFVRGGRARFRGFASYPVSLR